MVFNGGGRALTGLDQSRAAHRVPCSALHPVHISASITARGSLCAALEAQEFVKNVHNRDAERGRNAALTAAINQSTASGAKGAEARTSASRNTRLYEHELTSQKVQATKRQQLLREILVTNTDNLKSEGQQASG